MYFHILKNSLETSLITITSDKHNLVFVKYLNGNPLASHIDWSVLSKLGVQGENFKDDLLEE